MGAWDKLWALVEDPSTSFWMQEYIRGMSERDIVDVVNELEVIVALARELELEDWNRLKRASGSGQR